MNFPILKQLALLVCLAASGLVWGNVELSSALDDLSQEVQQGSQIFGVPITIRSNVEKEHFAAEAHGIVAHSFSEVADGLTNPANWCQFVPLTFNIKACTYHGQGDHSQLTIYAGRRLYQPPEDAYQVQYNYQVITRSDDYVRLLMSADKGPLGTYDYRIELDAMPVGEGTFVRIRSSYRMIFITRVAIRSYLATFGRSRVGFSVVGASETGEPIYVGGMKGAIERNAMRSYLSLKAFLDTNALSSDERFEARLRTWFDLSEAHAIQLHELERDEYLEAKRKERRDQLELQQQLDSAGKMAVQFP